VAALGLDSRTRLLLSPIGRTLLRSRGPAAGLLTSPGPAAALVRRALGRRLGREERAWTRRIEELRAELEASTDQVAFEESHDTPRREVGELCRTSSASPGWAELLFRLVRASRPQRCLELGTCLGVSACYQGAALRLNGAGRLITMEGRSDVAALASRTIARVGLGGEVDSRAAWFDEGLDRALYDLERVDYGFVDGHHDGVATLSYFERIRPRLSRGAVLVVDDIRWSADMHEAWRTIAAAPAMSDALDLGRLGLATAG